MSQTSPRVLLVGHCGPDCTYLRMVVSSAIPGAQILMIDNDQQLQSALAEGAELILFNRELDGDFAAISGIDHVRFITRSHPQMRTMLISNYPEAQAAAVAAGAQLGFGKRQLGSPEVRQLLREVLASK